METNGYGPTLVDFPEAFVDGQTEPSEIAGAADRCNGEILRALPNAVRIQFRRSILVVDRNELEADVGVIGAVFPVHRQPIRGRLCNRNEKDDGSGGEVIADQLTTGLVVNAAQQRR
ncbi:MAG: hypothetical protein ABEJ48_02955 [Halobacteriales archaeon]